MPLRSQNSVVMSITELRRTGAGTLEETSTKFEWTGAAHSSAKDTISPKLGTKVARREMPGSNEVVHQALAATWQPFPISGEWRDIWMGQGEAMRMYQEFARLCSRMPLVRMILDQLTFTGMILDPEFKYHHEGWIEWTFTMSPETNETVQNEILMGDGPTDEKRSISSWSKDIDDESNRLLDANSRGASIPLGTEHLLNVNAVLQPLSSAIERLDATVAGSAVTETSADVVSLTRGVGGDITDLYRVLPDAYERVHRSAIDVAVAFRDERADNNVAFDDLISIFNFETWKNEMIVGSWRTAGFAIDAARDARSRTNNAPLAIYRPAPGESFERISFRFYGTPNNAQLLRDRNHIQYLFLQGTEDLIIPRLDVQ